MCSRREFPLTTIDCTGITKMNQLISNPLSVQEATCLIFNCRRVSFRLASSSLSNLGVLISFSSTANTWHQAGTVPRVGEQRSSDQLPVERVVVADTGHLRPDADPGNAERGVPATIGRKPDVCATEQQPAGAEGRRKLPLLGGQSKRSDGGPANALCARSRPLHESIW